MPYESQVPGLGRAFIAELDATLAFLKLHPQMHAAVSEDGNVRQDEINWNLPP